MINFAHHTILHSFMQNKYYYLILLLIAAASLAYAIKTNKGDD